MHIPYRPNKGFGNLMSARNEIDKAFHGHRSMSPSADLVLRPHTGWQPIDLREIYRSRELFGFLIWRDIKIRYKQTILGGLWAVFQPLTAMLVFTLFFHRLAGIQTDGPPYPLFAFSGLVLWSFFANSVSMSSNSLVGNQVLVSKIYFPRIFIPLASIGALGLDLVIGLLLVFAMMIYYRWPVVPGVLLIPVYVLGTLSFILSRTFRLATSFCWD
jgi:lipopolysaccharide transport system permease protein